MNLFDTNILVYAYDDFEKEKREKCFRIVKKVFEGELEGYISNQILGELFFVLTRNMKRPLPVEKAKEIVISFKESVNWKKINYNEKSVVKAINFVEKFGISFWDALIAATMLENNIFTIYTENEKDFKKVPALRIINPFS